MSEPVAVCVIAVAAAVLAALLGRALNPGRRARRARAEQRQAALYWVAGTLAVNADAWIAFWYEHELDDLNAPGRGA